MPDLAALEVLVEHHHRCIVPYAAKHAAMQLSMKAPTLHANEATNRIGSSNSAPTTQSPGFDLETST